MTLKQLCCKILSIAKEVNDLLPNTNAWNVEMLSDFSFKEPTSNTYKLNYDKNDLKGFVDNLEAVKQAIYLILNIERYEYLIYDWDYGFQISDLIGSEINSILPEIQNRITDALIQDTRINSVDDFSFDIKGLRKEVLKEKAPVLTGAKKNKVIVYFTVNTIFGATSETVNLNI